ncbi:PIN domain-containing protein [Streptomyces sannanensis]|uniref:PIN domain-containing protein n=1 Tax=Streptomyces sannanensis TaxID=285536 RepID=A0ABP6SJ27_9ACTN
MIVLDHTAVVALCRGHRLLSGLAVVGVEELAQRAHVPALCLVAAGLELPGAAGHVGALPGLEFLPLDFAGAAAVEQAVSAGIDWTYAHAVYAAVSGPVDGHILTATPEAYDGTGVWAVDIGKP